MIYKLKPALLSCNQFALDQDEIEEKLGEDCLIFMDSRPTHYLPHWQTIGVAFFDEYPGGSKDKQNPDIMPDNLGKLFVNARARATLKPLLENAGEWLPVLADGEPGYLFNPLQLAEDYQAVDDAGVTRDRWGALEAVAFVESRLAGIALFRTAVDDYRGIYCNEAFRQAAEAAGLKGVVFSADLGDRPLV